MTAWCQTWTIFQIDSVQDNRAERNDSECEATGFNELYKTTVLSATIFQIDIVQNNRAERNDSQCEDEGFNELCNTIVLNAAIFQIEIVLGNIRKYYEILGNTSKN